MSLLPPGTPLLAPSAPGEQPATLYRPEVAAQAASTSTDGSVVFGGIPVATNDDATALEIGAGLDVQVTKTVGFYATAGYTTNIDGEHRKSFSGNAGVRVAW